MIYTYLRPLPGYCKEMVAPNEDGSYTIIINDALTDEEKWDAYCHAMRHIESDHFQCGDADRLERECHRAEEEDRRTI